MKHTLKLSEILPLASALAALDGYNKAIGDKTIVVPYKFNDETRRAIVRNKRRLKPILEEWDEVRSAIFHDISGGKESIDSKNEEAIGQLQARSVLAMSETHEVDLMPIDEADLLHDNANPIPGSVLEALWPLTDPTPATPSAQN